MLRRSLPRFALLAGTLAATTALSACGTSELTDLRAEGVGSGIDAAGWDRHRDEQVESLEPDIGLKVEPGTRDEAQTMVMSAERRFLEEPSAHFEVWWFYGGDVEMPMEGRFDLLQPAAELEAGPDDSNRYQLRLRGEDTWMRATIDGRAMDCWLHVTGGASDGGPMGVTYQAALLVEPRAVGFQVEGEADYEGAEVGQRVILDLPLDVALPAVIPRLGGLTATPIDPKATVRGVAVVGVSGRVTSVEYRAVDLFAALKASSTGIPRELRPLAKDPYVRSMSARVEYHDYGTDVRIPAPPRAKVADLGGWSDILAGVEDPSGREPGGVPSCAAALTGG